MAPQIILMALFFVSMLLHARDHGKPKTGKGNFWTAFIAAVIQIGLMAWGGFFDNVF